MIRGVPDDWGQCFIPARGYAPPAITPRRDERLVHVALITPDDPQAALRAALRSMTVDGGAYEEVDWIPRPRRACQAVLEAAARIKPTLLFAQIQTAGVLTPECIDRVRELAPGCVCVQWDGDRRTGPGSREREWYRHVGRAFDANLVSCVSDAREWARLGVPGSGYLQIGCDTELSRPVAPAEDAPDVVFMASYYPHLRYASRLAIAQRMTRELGDGFRVYGYSWGSCAGTVRYDGFVDRDREAALYSGAKAAISSSIRSDLERYTSDRLFRAMACGALVLVEEFAGYKDLGLEHGNNCLIWRDLDGLVLAARDVMRGEIRHADEIRAAARRLICRWHTWDVRMHELAAIVATIRSRRMADAR